MQVDEMVELMGIVLPEERNFHTVAGFMIDRMGRLPAVGESIDAHGWNFEVVDLDGRRVDKVLATKRASKRRLAS